MNFYIQLIAAIALSCCHVYTQKLPEGITLPPGFSLPPGFTLPPDFTIPDFDNLPVNYVGVHQALIIPRGSNVNTGQPICNGVILLNYTIATSASCLLKANGNFYSANELSVAVGFLTIEGNGIQATIEPQYFDVRDVITHRRFNKNLKVNNLALIKLSGNVEITQAIIPMIHSNIKVFEERDCVALGWKNYQTEAINITAIPRSTCIKSIDENDFPLEAFCAEKSQSFQDSCAEGSAIVCSGMLQGIISSCNDEILIITDVSQFYYWLLIQQLGDGPEKFIDNEYFRYFVGSVLDFVAWYSEDPSLADKVDVLKMFF